MHSFRKIVGPLLGGVVLAAAGSAGAEANPYYIGAKQAFSYESNLYNLDNTEPQPANVTAWTDALSTTSINGGLDQLFGRQRVYFKGNVEQNIYKRNTRLNNTGYGFDGGLDWATIERLTGTVRLKADQGLSGFNLYGTPENFEKNVQTTQQAVVTARWGMTPRLGLELGYNYLRVSMSNEAKASNEYSENTGKVGLSYGEEKILTLGAAFRFSKKDYPNYLPGVADVADGRNIDVTASWVPNGLSKVEGRLSFSDMTHTKNTANDFRGLSGLLRWEYRPTGKLFTRLSLVVAPGSGANFNDLSGDTTPAADIARSSTTLRLGATYQLTAKTEIIGFVSLANDRLAQETNGVVETGTARNPTAQIGAKYSPTRNIDLLCSLRYQARSTNSDLASPYSGTVVLCSGELLLQ